MDLMRMLEKCHAGQWQVGDLDWSQPPRPMDRVEEMTAVQYFTNMAGIERLAKALFEEQRRRTRDPVLADIFTTFIADEERHAVVAERLAAHYDVHRYQRYQMDPALVEFRPVFLAAIREVSAEVANVYITTGELLLDVALLRSLADYVDDPLCHQAMRLINRDESRHIAIDYHMVEYYVSPEYRDWLKTQPARKTAEYISAAWTFARMLYRAGPFIRRVFIQPIRLLDPSNRRMHEAFKRVQMLGKKPEVARRPFTVFLRVLQRAHHTPYVGVVFNAAITRLAGVPGDALDDMVSAEECTRAMAASYQDLAREAVAMPQA